MLNKKTCVFCGDKLMRINEMNERYICYRCGITNEVMDFFNNHKPEYLRVESFTNVITNQVKKRLNQEFITIDIFVDGEQYTLSQFITDVAVDLSNDIMYIDGKPLSGDYDVLENTVNITVALKTKELKQIEKECSSCNGTGVILYSGHEKCYSCNGMGKTIKYK